jgi:hypothetical protein
MKYYKKLVLNGIKTTNSCKMIFNQIKKEKIYLKLH